LVDFLFVVGILWNDDMSNAWLQESSDCKLWHDGMCIFMNCDLLFPAFVGTLFFVKHFQAKVNGDIFCSSFGFRDKILYYQRGKNE